MAKFLLAVVALIALQGSFGKPVVEKSQLEILTENAKNLAQNVTATLGIQDLTSQKVVKAINEQTRNLANTVQTVVDKLKAEAKAHQGDVDNVVKQVEQQLSQTAATLQKAAGPEATAKAAELRTKFDDGLKDAVTEIEKLVKNLQPGVEEAQNNIKSVAKTALDKVVEIGQSIQDQVKTAIAEHEKTHKN